MMGKRSARKRMEKWGEEGFRQRMSEWGKLGGRPPKAGSGRKREEAKDRINARQNERA